MQTQLDELDQQRRAELSSALGTMPGRGDGSNAEVMTSMRQQTAGELTAVASRFKPIEEHGHTLHKYVQIIHF